MFEYWNGIYVRFSCTSTYCHSIIPIFLYSLLLLLFSSVVLLAVLKAKNLFGFPSTPAYTPDLGHIKYRNPIRFGDYSDPDVIRLDNDLYLVSSGFCAVPGLQNLTALKYLF